VTFAEFRDRRKIFDIEGYSRQQFKAEVIPGWSLQRAPQTPRGDFGGRGAWPFMKVVTTQSRDRRFGGPARGGNDRGGFDRGGFGGGFAGRGGPAPRGAVFLCLIAWRESHRHWMEAWPSLA
jgi:hypothetical protein